MSTLGSPRARSGRSQPTFNRMARPRSGRPQEDVCTRPRGRHDCPTMPDPIAALRAKLLSDQRSARTIQTYIKISSAFLGTLSGSTPSTDAVETFLARPRRDGARRATTARNQELAALRSLARVAVREKSWDANPTEGIEFARKAPRDPPFLGTDELRRLFRAAVEHPPAKEGAQILAIIGLLLQTGLRIRELVGLNVRQIDLATGTFVTVHGKGGTVHDVPLNAPSIALLGAWLRERAGRAPPGEDALFLSSRRTRLAVRTVENWFVKLRAPMGTAKKVTPHTLRHSTATSLIMAGVDLATTAEVMRHRDVNTTRGYIHLVDTRRRDAVQRLAPIVPTDILDAVAATTAATDAGPCLPQETAPATPKTSTSARPENLDDQYRLVAKKASNRPCIRILSDQHRLDDAA